MEHKEEFTNPFTNLPDLKEEDERPLSASQIILPPIGNNKAASTESLMEALGLASANEKSLSSQLHTVRSKVASALQELQTITTHDDNLEQQYKETVAENIKLSAALEKARRDIRHLRGQLSILQMTRPEIREYRARTRHRSQRTQTHETQIREQRAKEAGTVAPVLSAAERSKTVNARGEYIDYSRSGKKPRSRLSTYPTLSSRHPPKSKATPLPPFLEGCTCSECNSRQSLGAITLNMPTAAITKSGQQLILGDRVIIKGEKLGTVRYIGKLEHAILDTLFIGIHLDLPIGICDGSLKGQRYFHCPPDHGAFVRASEILCVTGRRARSVSTSLPRVQRERLPTAQEIIREANSRSKTPADQTVDISLSATSSTLSHAVHVLESELSNMTTKIPADLSDDSVQKMAKQIGTLSSRKSRRTSGPSSNTTTPLPARPTAPEPRTPPTPTNNAWKPFFLAELGEKDLGDTGYVLIQELTKALLQLGDGQLLSTQEVEQLYATCGIETVAGVGIPYKEKMKALTGAIIAMKGL
ncbi:hypothetical protein EMCRGX_G018678 [Ephydatia muelleri]